ncbi:HNH endonuclease [Terasakiella sp. SH-1]|uniref:HNH endonuclease n=1 Tax=Terasakiella sp. SH-1 TaxID=2560057 RepID=UPI0014315A6B|nr:HNH endonuclease [Terasakiella sp. SH-1]
MEDLSRTCFFCNQEINEKKSLEHIIPNSLLGQMKIKEETLNGVYSSQYSKIKVPAHTKCNNEFGSRYEDHILKLLNDPEGLFNDLNKTDMVGHAIFTPTDDSFGLISTWLGKIFYGLFYNDYLKTNDQDWKEVCYEVISSVNFKIIQNAYEKEYGFSLPSSLYVFQTESDDFDLLTRLHPYTLLLKIKNLVFIICLEDGFLTKSYMGDEGVESLRDTLKKLAIEHPKAPVHHVALCEIMALRLSIPKTPKFVSSNNQIMNMSFMTAVANSDKKYALDQKLYHENRKYVLSEHGIRFD